MTAQRKSAAKSVGRRGAKPSARRSSNESLSHDEATRLGQNAPTVVCEERKPVAPPVRKAGIPASLRALDRWICWRYTLVKKRWTKTPHSPTTGRKVDATNLAKGVAFEEAMASLRESGDSFDGIGFLLGSGIGGIDVDDCIDESGNLDERGKAVSEAFRSTYAEVSPSRRGFKLLVNIGDDEALAAIGKNNGEMEIYGGQRFFTVTGHALAGHAKVVAHMPDQFRKLAESIGARTESRKTRSASSKPRSGIDLAAARELFDHLPSNWIEQYGDWLRGGMALHHEFGGAVEALQLWIDVSQRCPEKFEEGVCEAKWLTFGKAGKDEVTVRTLLRDARSIGWNPPATIAAAIAKFDAVKGDLFDDEEGMDYETGRERMERIKTVFERPILGALLPLGVSVFAGDGGAGKSTILATAAAHVTNGSILPPWEPRNASPRKPGRVLWLTVEEDVDRIVLPRHHRLGGDLDRIIVPVMPRKKLEDGTWAASTFNIDTDLHKLLQKARDRKQDISLVVADSLPGLVQWERRSTNNETDVKQLLSQLREIASFYDCAIAGIHHWNKKVELAEEFRMSGAQAWRTTPRLTWTIDKGFIYTNKANDMPEIGCAFRQEVVAVLYEVPVEMKDGKPLQVAARRAAFGEYLMRKDEVLSAKKAASEPQLGEPRLPDEGEDDGDDKLSKAARNFFDCFGDVVDAGDLWETVAAQNRRGELNGDEKKKVCKALNLTASRDGKRHLLSIVAGDESTAAAG